MAVSSRAFHLGDRGESEEGADVAAFGAVLEFEFPAPGNDVLPGIRFHDGGGDVGEGADPGAGADAAIDSQRGGAISDFALAGREMEDGFGRVFFEPGFAVGGADIGAPAFAGVDGGGDVVGVAAEADRAVNGAIKSGEADAEQGEEDSDVNQGFFEEEALLETRPILEAITTEP